MLCPTKICSKCDQEKPSSEFYKAKSGVNGLRGDCKDCCKKWHRSYYEKHKSWHSQWRKEYHERNKEWENQRAREWYYNNKDYYLEYQKSRTREDPGYKCTVFMRNCLYRVLFDKAGQKTIDILGYSQDELKSRIEFNFQPGMAWDNYGETWEIDHKIPVKYFQNKGENRPHIVNALSNLQPMWKEENSEKGQKFPHAEGGN